MSLGADRTPAVDVAAWWLLRGKNDGDNWATNNSDTRELIVWADISDFEHYMGQLPFPYDNAAAVELYEAGGVLVLTLVPGRTLRLSCVAFSHRHYAGGFLEAVYEVCRSRLGLDR